MTQIVRAGRTATEVVVAFDIEWEGDLAGSETVLWEMVITSPDGAETVELGYEMVQGIFSGQFVRDSGTGRQQQVDEDADLGDHRITVRFPASKVGVAAEWPTWKAVLNVNGRDVTERAVAPN